MTSPLGNAGKYSKAIVAVAGAGTIALEQLALTLPSSKSWVPVATSVIAAVVTYLVPNQTPDQPQANTSLVDTSAIEREVQARKQAASGSDFPS